MNDELGEFRVPYGKVLCWGCSWTLAHQYQSSTGQVRIEVSIRYFIVSMREWPEYIKCGRCGCLNTTADMLENIQQLERTARTRVG